MDEKEIKATTLDYLLKNEMICRGSVVANEFALAGASVRADLAILADRFVGIEVKSAKDGLKRLGQQMIAYREYFDSVMLVISTKHIKSVKARDYPGVSIFEIDNSGNIALLNPAEPASYPAPINRLRLLTQLEIRRSCGREKIENSELRERGVNCVELVDCKEAFATAFTTRYGQSSRLFWQTVEHRNISASDLEILSRYRDLRQAATTFQRQKEVEWNNWLSELRELSGQELTSIQSDQMSSVS